jgi:KDO2-lipid IV(A) lauroyltransferase
MLFFLLYKIGEFVALRLPRGFSYGLAVVISRLKYAFSPTEKQEMIENLRCFRPHNSTRALKKDVKEILANFSLYLVDFFRFKKIDLKYIEKYVEVVGENHLDDALAKGKGVILLSAHIGNWELGGAVIGVLGYPISVIALDHKNNLVNNFFINQRRIKGERIISLKFAVRKTVAALANNEFVAIVGDKDFTGTGAVVKLFGRDSLMPKGPAAISLKTGAVIVPGFMVRLQGEKCRLFFERPVEYSPIGDFEKDVVKFTELCTRRIEDVIKRFPTQWYCFRKFWLG